MRTVGILMAGTLVLLALPAGARGKGKHRYEIEDNSKKVTRIDRRDSDGKIGYEVTFRVKWTGEDTAGDEAKDIVVFRENGKVAYQMELGKIRSETFTTVLVLDTSGSMALPPGRPKIVALRAAAAQFIDKMPARARATLLPFSSRVMAPAPFTNDKESIKERIQRLRPGGGTVLYDAALAGVETVAAERPRGKRFVVVLTDGVDEDPGSRHGVDEVIARAREAKVNLYVVGLGPKEDLDEAVLGKLARETGGRYTHVSKTSDLADIYTGLVRELESTYTVSFPSRNQVQDATVSQITIEVQDREGNVISNTARQLDSRFGLVVPGFDYLIYLFLLVLLVGLVYLPVWLKRLSGPAAGVPVGTLAPPVARLVGPRR